MSNVYRAAVISTGRDFEVVLKSGRVISADREFCVRTEEGELVTLDGWHMNEAEAWVELGDRLDQISKRISDQASHCRQQAAGGVA